MSVYSDRNLAPLQNPCKPERKGKKKRNHKSSIHAYPLHWTEGRAGPRIGRPSCQAKILGEASPQAPTAAMS